MGNQDISIFTDSTNVEKCTRNWTQILLIFLFTIIYFQMVCWKAPFTTAVLICHSGWTQVSPITGAWWSSSPDPDLCDWHKTTASAHEELIRTNQNAQKYPINKGRHMYVAVGSGTKHQLHVEQKRTTKMTAELQNNTHTHTTSRVLYTFREASQQELSSAEVI